MSKNTIGLVSVRLGLLAALAVSTTASVASAVTIDGACSERNAFTLGNIDSRSYDGAGWDPFLPFASATGSLSQLGAFNGSTSGTRYEVTLLSLVAYYDGRHFPGISDVFGTVNENGQFNALIPGGNLPGFSTTFEQTSDEQLTFALQSPDSQATAPGVFSSVDAQNADGQAHIIAMEIGKPGTVNIAQADLWGSSLSFDLMVGDIVLFIEDLLYAGNTTLYGVPATSDFDYNDMVVVIRHENVPEPATAILLGAGMFGAAVSRRRKAR